MSEPATEGLQVRGLSAGYRERRVIDGLDLPTLHRGEVVSLVGPSGSGKSTIAHIAAGLITSRTGRITRGYHRHAMVFQEPRLMPWLTVFENMAFALDRQANPAATEQRVSATLDQLGLSAFRDAYPSQLSGGMAQRVSLGRTLCYNPDLILMDEPFGALDYFTRKKLQREIVDLFLREQKTIVFVTHDVSEAVYLGQKILVMEAGQLIREVSVDLPYPRQAADPALLQYQQEILDALGGV